MISRKEFEALSSEGLTRAWSGLGGSHTFVTYPPLDALQTLAPEPVLANFADVGAFSMYVHLPFCEMTCPFCPYETQQISKSGNMTEAYLRALSAEIKTAGEKLRHAAVQSLYIGGGTATVLAGSQLKALLAQLREHFAFSAESIICVETSPNALIENPSKIGLLKELGVKRVSVGVQTLSEAALRSEGRTHDPFQTVELLRTLIREIDVVNVDLMQDMPGQTEADLENDVSQIAGIGPSQITSYVERLRKWNGAYPDAYLSVVRRLWLRDRLKEHSYQPRPGGRFVRHGSIDDPFKSVRCGLDSHLVGLGASAYGHVPGFFYRNIVDTGAYIERVFAGQSPIAHGMQLRNVDVLAASLAAGVRWGVGLTNSEPDLKDYFRQAKDTLDMLIRHNLVSFDNRTAKYQITMDGLGWAYEEEICSLFVPENIVQQVQMNNSSWWFRTA